MRMSNYRPRHVHRSARWPKSAASAASPGPSDENVRQDKSKTSQSNPMALQCQMSKLGTGCQGIVWRGTLKRLPHPVKVIKAEKPSPLEVWNFPEGGRVMTSVAHACIASCYMVACRPYPAIVLDTGAGAERAPHERQWLHYHFSWSSKCFGSSRQKGDSTQRC